MLEIDVSDSLQKAETLLESMPGAAEKALQTSIRKSIRGAKKRRRTEGQRTLYYQAILCDADHESNVPGADSLISIQGPRK